MQTFSKRVGAFLCCFHWIIIVSTLLVWLNMLASPKTILVNKSYSTSLIICIKVEINCYQFYSVQGWRMEMREEIAIIHCFWNDASCVQHEASNIKLISLPPSSLD